MKRSKFIFLLSSLLLLNVACNKEDDAKNADSVENSMQDIAVAMNGTMEMDAIAEMSLEGDPNMKTGGLLSCATFSIDTTGSQNIITLDFGTNNCQGDDGVFRKGVLKITFEDNPFDQGSIHTISAINYGSNNYVYNGTRSVTYQGFNSDNNPYSTLSSTLTIDKPNNGGTIKWNSQRTRTWVEGFGNFNPFDNEFAITGTANGTTANNIAFNLNIAQALLVKANCNNIVAGELTISSPNFNTRTLNYGNGTCDNQATISVNGSSRVISLR